MTEQNWATEEAYRWLDNELASYEIIMATPENERRSVIIGIVTKWVAEGFMGNFSSSDYNGIDWDSLAADFADPVENEDGPRYGHGCRACTFLGHSGEYDVYHHDETSMQQIFLKNPDHESILLTMSQASAIGRALDMIAKHIKEIGR